MLPRLCLRKTRPKGGYACKCVCACQPGCRARHIVPEVRPAIVVFGHGMWGSYVDLLKGLSLSVASRSRLPVSFFEYLEKIELYYSKKNNSEKACRLKLFCVLRWCVSTASGP